MNYGNCAICGKEFDEESWDARHTSHLDGISDVHEGCCTAPDCIGFASDECEECSEDYGPCEAHIEVLVMREGGNTRTADELNSVFISDAVDLGVVLSESDAADIIEIDALLAEDHWLSNNEDRWCEILIDIRDRVESSLYELYAKQDEHLFVNFEDGYVIGKILPGSPLLN